MVGEVDVAVGGYVDVFVGPCAVGVHCAGVVAAYGGDDVDVVVLEEVFVGFLAAGAGVAVVVAEGFDGYEDGGAFGVVLFVVYPSDYGEDGVVECFVVHAVAAVEGDGLGVVGFVVGGGVGVLVFVAEECPDVVLFLGGDVLEAVFGDFFVFFDEGFGYDEFLLAVLAGVGVFLAADHVVGYEGFAHAEGGVDEDAVVAVELFCEHAAHGGAYYEVGVVLLADGVEVLDGFCGVEGEVGGYYVGVGEVLLDGGDGAGLSGGGEAVDV